MSERLQHALKWAAENSPHLQPLVIRHRAMVRKRMAAYMRRRRKRDTAFRLLGALRGRLYNALAGWNVRKSARTRELLGCTIVELKRHLESLWTEGMAWENYGEWHIDHIRPCAAFDLRDPAQQRACFHFSNLQPLWAMDNYRKSDKQPSAAQ